MNKDQSHLLLFSLVNPHWQAAARAEGDKGFGLDDLVYRQQAWAAKGRLGVGRLHYGILF